MSESARNAVTGFAGPHHADEPLLLPNAWDHASAAALAAQGFRAVGTTGLAVAAGAGLPDGAATTREQTLLLALTLGSGPYRLSVDAEDGSSDDPDEVASSAGELYAVGAVGINLEDGLGPVGRHAAKIAAVRAAVPALFVDARTDTYWAAGPDADGGSRREDTFRRLDAYQQAGAHGVFVPGLTGPREIAGPVRRFDVPLTVLYPPTGPSVPQPAGLGVRRISLGSLLYRRALGAAVEAATDIREGRAPTGTAPAYAEIQALSRDSVRGTADATASLGRPWYG
ncbi:isocitrate lyase/phosphoenolpyruvate mutase family protein [Streptomyces sp. NPDC058632]|uniref:isocitrate lyase/PEP mutase family protein n=1 Tax=unclassified Streptomyces TaxID=2593676 RepID=UPI00364FD5A3